MNTVYQQFQNILRGIDEDPTSIIEQEEIIALLNKVIPEGYETSAEERAEGLAFSFVDRFTKSEGETYFGSRISWQADDGSILESPSLKHVQSEMIDYWRERSGSVQHPFLIARYTGLAWDLSLPVTGKQSNPSLRKQFIQASIDLARNRQYKYLSVGVRWLSRALEIASRYNDQEFLVPIKDLILDYEKQLSEQEKPAEWGFAYDLLINNKRITISQDEEKIIIDRLEQKLATFSSPNKEGKTDPWACQHAASRLAEYYKRRNLPEEVKRVILSVGTAYEPLFDGSAAFQVAGWMQKVHQLYLYHQLNREADEMLKRFRKVSALAAEEMGGFEHKFTFPKEETDAMVESLFTDSEETAFVQLVQRFMPDKAQSKEMVYELAKLATMQFHFPVQLQDHKGRPVANVGPLAEDEDGHIVLRITEQLQFSALLLHLALEKGQEKGMIHKESILSFLSNTPVIGRSRFQILENALQYYFSGDYMAFIHLTIPQIEEATRNLVEISGSKSLKYKDGVYQLRTFDDILRDSAITTVCGENIQLYFRILFTDARGWNLRNEICHGLMEPELFTKVNADRVLHALLTLGMIRKAEE